MGKIVEFITARGHPLITAKHRTTLMFTKDKEVGFKGDCIVGVLADKGAAGLHEELKSALKSEAAVKITIEAGGEIEKVRTFGHPSLTFTHPKDLVIRKSRFTCGRTLSVGADKAAIDLSRALVAKLRDPSTKVKVTIEVGGVTVTHRAACGGCHSRWDSGDRS
ncbi:MAG: DUF371 domain-containing protein [Candidatus Hadarchaeaceae archaeon]